MQSKKKEKVLSSELLVSSELRNKSLLSHLSRNISRSSCMIKDYI